MAGRGRRREGKGGTSQFVKNTSPSRQAGMHAEERERVLGGTFTVRGEMDCVSLAVPLKL